MQNRPATHPTPLTSAVITASGATSSLPVLMRFEKPGFQTWLPSLDLVAAAFPERVRVERVDVNTYPELQSHFNVRMVPTMVLLNGSKPSAYLVGIYPIRFILDWVSKALQSCSSHHEPAAA